MSTCHRNDLQPAMMVPSGVPIPRGFWLVMLVFILALIGGCVTTTDEKPKRSVAPKESLESKSEASVPPQKGEGVAEAPMRMIAEARSLVEKNRLDAAMLLYRRILQEFGQTDQANEARFRLGEVLMLQGQTEQALPFLIDAASKSNQPYAWESLSLVGDIQEQRGDVEGAWSSWIRVAYSGSTQAMTPWKKFLKSYMQNGNAENTQRLFLMLPPGQLSSDQTGVALTTADQVETERLKQLHAIQPPQSPFTPLFALILGDRQYQEGGSQGAMDYWKSANGSDLASLEAQRRLAPADNQPGLTMGLLLPLSGDYATIGKNLLKAIKKGLRDYPDTKIILRVADSHGKAEEARSAMEQFRLDGVGAVIGPVFQEEAKAAAEVAARYNIPIVTLNPRDGIVPPGSSVFQNAFRPETEGQLMAKFAVEEKKFRRIAVLAPDSEYGHLLTQTFSDAVRQSGGTIVRVTFFPTGTSDFSPWIKALVNADPKDIQARTNAAGSDGPLDPVEAVSSGSGASLRPWSDFDALFLPANAQEVRLIAPQAAFFKLRQPQVTFLGTSLWNKPELFKEGADFIKGAFFCDSDDVARNRFSESFYQVWKDTPSSLDMLAYDSVALVAQSLRVERMSGRPWYSVLKGGQRIYGAAGVVYFDEGGQSRRDLYVYKIEADGPKKMEAMPFQGQIGQMSVPENSFQPGDGRGLEVGGSGREKEMPMGQSPGMSPPPGALGPSFF
ncbi:MAG: penicillin-binding protein activator [Nitrospirae bacterium]|nr:penicillin-binding protein activator [Magnetococcales bacterium]